MVERWHLDLAVTALVLGLVVAGADRWAGARAARHAVGAAGLIGAVLGGWSSDRMWVWSIGALTMALWPDDVSAARPVVRHPLGPWTVALTVVSLVGVWSAVPDTEPPLVAGCILVGLGAERLVTGRAVGRPGTAALVVAVAGAVWVGSAGWGAALTSACAIGMVLCAPIAVGFSRSDLSRGGRRPFVLPALIGVHVVAALGVPRLLMRLDVAVASTIASVVLVVMVVIARTVVDLGAGGDRDRDAEHRPGPADTR